MVVLGGGQILAQGQEPASRPQEVLKRPGHFIMGFPQPQHKARFGGNGGVDEPNPLNQLQGSMVKRLRSDLRVQPGNGLHIMIEHMRGCRHDGLEIVL